jgi:putative transposase
MQRALTRHDMVGSIGQVGSAADNAAMESFFSLLQRNVLGRHRWATRDELRIAIVTWMNALTTDEGDKPPLGRLTPIEWETIMTNTAAYAA